MSYEVVHIAQRYDALEITGQTYWHVTLRWPSRGHYESVGMINVPAKDEREARNAVIAYLAPHGGADDRRIADLQDDPATTARYYRQRGYDDPAATSFTREGIEAVMAKHPAGRKLLSRHYREHRT